MSAESGNALDAMTELAKVAIIRAEKAEARLDAVRIEVERLKADVAKAQSQCAELLADLRRYEAET